MKNVNFEQDELVVMAIYAEKTREKTIETLKEALDDLEVNRQDADDEEMIGIVHSLIEKLQQIEDKYFYSLDLEAYLRDLEDDEDDN